MEKQSDFNQLDYDRLSILDLFFSPRKFFSRTVKEDNAKYLILVTLILGISAAISRFDSELVKENLGRNSIFLQFADTWLSFWVACLILGGISSFFIWYFGGWWYRMRIKLSGAKDPDVEEARHVYIYSSFVSEAPNVFVAIIYTIFYSNYFEANLKDNYLYLIALCFVFGSLITSYIGAREVFDVSKWKARLWLIILPALFYLTAMGAVGFFIGKVSENKYIASTSIPENRIVESSDSLATLRLPENWVNLKNLADNASFQIGDPYNEVYCIVFTDSKNELQCVLDDYYKIMTENMLDGLTEMSIIEYGDSVTTKYNSRTGLIKGTFDHLRLMYLCHVIETEQNFYRLVFWTMEEEGEKQIPVFSNVIKSFTEIEK